MNPTQPLATPPITGTVPKGQRGHTATPTRWLADRTVQPSLVQSRRARVQRATKWSSSNSPHHVQLFQHVQEACAHTYTGDHITQSHILALTARQPASKELHPRSCHCALQVGSLPIGCAPEKQSQQTRPCTMQVVSQFTWRCRPRAGRSPRYRPAQRRTGRHQPAAHA